MARALQLEGERAGQPRAIDFATQEVATCGRHERVGEVLARVAASPLRFALVLSEDRVVLGRLRRAVLEGDPDAVAEQVMEPGPSTTRPDLDLAKLLARLEQRQLTTAIITDPEGRLLGVVRRHDLPAA